MENSRNKGEYVVNLLPDAVRQYEEYLNQDHWATFASTFRSLVAAGVIDQDTHQLIPGWSQCRTAFSLVELLKTNIENAGGLSHSDKDDFIRFVVATVEANRSEDVQAAAAALTPGVADDTNITGRLELVCLVLANATLNFRNP